MRIVANWYNVDTLTTSPSQINWLLFVSIYTIISVAYLELAPRFMSKSTSYRNSILSGSPEWGITMRTKTMGDYLTNT